MEETKWCWSLSPNLDRATPSSPTEALDRVNQHPRGVNLSYYVAMQIQIRLPAEVGPRSDPLPPVLAKISANETLVIELQGSIEIEGEKSRCNKQYTFFLDTFPPRSILGSPFFTMRV